MCTYIITYKTSSAARTRPQETFYIFVKIKSQENRENCKSISYKFERVWVIVKKIKMQKKVGKIFGRYTNV